MRGMVKPDKLPPFVRALIAEAKRQEWTGYRFKVAGVMSASAAGRFLRGELNPTAATCHDIALALGLTITVQK
jgi:hypothetical protein